MTGYVRGAGLAPSGWARFSTLTDEHLHYESKTIFALLFLHKLSAEAGKFFQQLLSYLIFIFPENPEKWVQRKPDRLPLRSCFPAS
jgi:hypothetical protein